MLRSSSPSSSSCSAPSTPPQSQKRERSSPQKGRQPKHHIIPNSKSTSTPRLLTPRASPNPLPAPSSQLKKPPAYQKRHTHQKKPKHHQPSPTPLPQPDTRRLTPDASHVIAQPGPREWNVGATHTTTPHHTAPHRTTGPPDHTNPPLFKNTQTVSSLITKPTRRMAQFLSQCTHAHVRKIASRPRCARRASCSGRRRGFGDDTRVWQEVG